MEPSAMGIRAAPLKRVLRHMVGSICGAGLCGLSLLACASGLDATRVTAATPTPPPSGLEHRAQPAEYLSAASSGERVPTFVEVIEPRPERDDAYERPHEPFATAALLEQPCTGATAAWFSLGSTELDAQDRLRLNDLLRCLEDEPFDAAALVVEGYATPLEEAVFGRDLASERARVVAAYLDVRAALSQRTAMRIRANETTP